MPETLKLRINEDVKAAMRAGDKQRLGTLRLITAAIKQREVDERIELDDPQVLSVLEKMSKQRRESMEMYQRGNRADLVAQESFELGIIQSYLPQPLNDAEIDDLVTQAIAQAGASGIKDMGRVMTALRPLIQGRADMTAVSALVKARLSS
jgi:uncharacterized protein YqeY